MLEYQLSINIDRPIQEVFAFIAHPKNMPLWASYIEEAELIPDGPIEVGSKMRYTVRGREAIWDVTSYEPDEHIKFEADYWYASNASMTYMVAEEEGGTRLTVHDRGERSGWMRLIAPLMSLWDRSIRKRQLVVIKGILESMVEEKS